MGDEGKKHKKTERVMVHCRVRPLNDEDIRSYGKDTIIDTIDQSKGLIVLKRDYDKKTFVYDAAFDVSSNQKEIYTKIGEPVVSSVLQGYNGTIFAYGQTGTGKTFTMIGSTGENKGVIPRSMAQIFSFIQNSTTHSFSVRIGFLQLYMEMLQDLIVPDDNKVIRIREDPDEGVYLTGVSWTSVSNVKQCMDLLAIGDRNRSTAYTSMNAHSSRSHAVYMVKIEKRVKYTPEQLEELEKKGDMPDQSMTKSTLYLVDLAGSERVKKSRASGNRLDEAKNINLALLALGNCIQALSDKKAKYVPFRDSKLTRILEDSLGGNSKTSLIVTVGPSVGHLQETLSALQFGLRAMKIENRPEINVKVDYRALCAQLQAELDKVNDGSNMFNIEKDQYLEEISTLKNQIERLMAEKEQMEALLEEYRKGHNDLKQFEDVKKAEIQKLQANFRAKLEKKEVEHKKFLEEIDKLMVDQEKEVKELKNANIELKNQTKMLRTELQHAQEELEQEKADRQIRATQLVTEIDELKEKFYAEKTQNQGFQQEIEKLQQIKLENERALQELNENFEFHKHKSSQEIENMQKELQKSQAQAEKIKTQLQQKAVEYKESSEKQEKTWQDSWGAKEKQYSDKIKQLEQVLNSQNLSITQLQRENASLKEDIKIEKENLEAQNSKCEKLKENYEERLNKLSNELNLTESQLAQMNENREKLVQQLELEKKAHKDEVHTLTEDLKLIKQKTVKLARCSKELELKNHSTAKEAEDKLIAKDQEIELINAKFTYEKEELLKELQEANEQINSLNKDRSKLIAKTESLAKKTSNIVKMKEKLSTEAEVKQQEFKSLMEQRESLEEEVEQQRNYIEQLKNAIKGKESSNEELKTTVLSLSNECHKKETNLDNAVKKIADLEKSVMEMEWKIEEINEKNKELMIDLEKSKTNFKTVSENLQKALSEKTEILKESKVFKENLDKSVKEMKKLTEDCVRLEAESAENSKTLLQQKEQISQKYQKLADEYKTLEISSSNLKSEIKQKKFELASIKDSLSKYSSVFSSNIRLLQENLVKFIDSKLSLLTTTQDTLLYYISKLKENLRNKEFQFEKVQNSSKKEILLINESHAKEVLALKASHKDVIDNMEDRNSAEIQELQSYYEDIIKKSNSKNEKAQEELKNFYSSQIEHLNATHFSSIEDLKAMQSKIVNDLKTTYNMELAEMREELNNRISIRESDFKRNSSKSQEELAKLNKEWEEKFEHLKVLNEENLNSLMKAKQKEIEQLMKENLHLRNEFENTLDRQKSHSSTMKSHQLGIIEEIKKSNQQDLEALSIEFENKLKRKENELGDLKKKLKEIIEDNDENAKEVDEQKAIVEKYRVDCKKIEGELKKSEYSRQTLEENLKLIMKKLEIEKSKNVEFEANLSEANEKCSSMAEEKKKIEAEIKAIRQSSKKMEDELIKAKKAEIQELENKLTHTNVTLSSQNYEAEAKIIMETLVSRVEFQDMQNSIKRLQESLKKANMEKTQISQTFDDFKSKASKESSESYECISVLIIDKISLSLELDEQKRLKRSLDVKIQQINESLLGNYDTIIYLKQFLKDHKKGENLFDFLSLFANFYSKVSEKLPSDSDSIKVFNLSKLVHEKYLSNSRVLALKSEKSKRPYEKPMIEIEKELGCGSGKSESQQEILAKKAKDLERTASLAVSSLMDHMLLVLELQQIPLFSVKSYIEDRKRQTEALFPLELIKSLEITGIPKAPASKIPIFSSINELKTLSTHLSAMLTMISAMYTCILSRNIQLEYIADERADFISMLISYIKINSDKAKQYKAFTKNKEILESAATLIQRRFRSHINKEKKRKNHIEGSVRIT